MWTTWTRRGFTKFFSKNVLQSVLVYDDGDKIYVDQENVFYYDYAGDNNSNIDDENEVDDDDEYDNNDIDEENAMDEHNNEDNNDMDELTIDLLLKLFPSPLPLFHPLGQKLDQQLARSGGFVKVAEFLRYWCGDRGS